MTLYSVSLNSAIKLSTQT